MCRKDWRFRNNFIFIVFISLIYASLSLSDIVISIYNAVQQSLPEKQIECYIVDAIRIIGITSASLPLNNCNSFSNYMLSCTFNTCFLLAEILIGFLTNTLDMTKELALRLQFIIYLTEYYSKLITIILYFFLQDGIEIDVNKIQNTYFKEILDKYDSSSLVAMKIVALLCLFVFKAYFIAYLLRFIKHERKKIGRSQPYNQVSTTPV